MTEIIMQITLIVIVIFLSALLTPLVFKIITHLNDKTIEAAKEKLEKEKQAEINRKKEKIERQKRRKRKIKLLKEEAAKYKKWDVVYVYFEWQLVPTKYLWSKIINDWFWLINQYVVEHGSWALGQYTDIYTLDNFIDTYEKV